MKIRKALIKSLMMCITITRAVVRNLSIFLFVVLSCIVDRSIEYFVMSLMYSLQREI